MQYKTIVLEMIQDRPQLYDRLLKERALLSTLEAYAGQLRDSHHIWKGRLLQARPQSDESQIAKEALELALKQLEDSLPPDSPPEEDGPLSLEGAMAFLRRHTLPA
jgi:hypothetical protein